MLLLAGEAEAVVQRVTGTTTYLKTQERIEWV